MHLFDMVWFVRHQRVLLWLVNAPAVRVWFRRVLCLDDRRRIVALRPNSFTIQEDGLTFTTDVRTHAKYAKRLYWAFQPLWYLLHAWDWLADPLLPALSCGFSTLTAYPDAGDPGSVSGDAVVFRSGVDQTWANIIAGAGTGHDATAVSAIAAGYYCSTTSSQFSRVYRAPFHFDTSGLGAGATISAATLSLKGTDKQDQNSAAPDLNVYQSTVSSNTTFANADFQSVGSTAFATAISYAAFSASAYNDFALNANGLANISKTGVSKFATRNANYDVAATPPAWGGSGLFSYFGASFADETGTTSDPKLVVTYTLPASVVGARLSRRNSDQSTFRYGA